MPAILSFCYKVRLGEQSWSEEIEVGSTEDIHETTHEIVHSLHQKHKKVQATFRVPSNLEEGTLRILSYKAEAGQIICTDLGMMLPKQKLHQIFPALKGEQSLKEILLSL